MVTGLLSKSRTYATEVVGNRIWHQVCERLLTSTISNYWVSKLSLFLGVPQSIRLPFMYHFRSGQTSNLNLSLDHTHPPFLKIIIISP